MRWLILGIFFILALLALALARVTVRLEARLTGVYGPVSVRVGLLFSLIRLNFRFEIRKNPKTPGIDFCFMRKDGRAVSFIKPGKKKQKRCFKLKTGGGVKLRALKVSGRIGLKDEPFGAVMLTGAMMLLVINAIELLVAQKHKRECAVHLLPVFNRNLLRLNLVSILTVAPAQIIYATLTNTLRNKKKDGGRFGASNREHFKNDYGAVKGNGGC